MNRKNWTPQEDSILVTCFPHVTTKELSAQMGRSEGAISARASAKGLRKTPECRAASQVHEIASLRANTATRFQKGHTPFNKGKKQPPEVREKMLRTAYKKGNEPHNTKYDGSQRISKDGYIEVRVSKGKFRFLHRIVWEQANGPIPPGYLIAFRDGNKQNADLENLVLRSHKEHMMHNTIQRYPAEIIGTIKLIHKLKKRIADATK